ncbi:MAG: CHC2 zinc finger domain-containing protein, partial [Gammaproteobacteria bacterium]|nr:CHC2 zinc finger domain-containing protein [Gammaproteobacteria bacterium]
MGKIPQTFIDNLLSRINIVDVINARVPLKKKGSNYMACCPFHHEKTPSFSVNPSKQFYYCFGCGASGSAISFLMDYENLPFPDAIESLADTVGLAVPQTASSTSLSRYDALYALLSDTENYYREQLHKHPHAQEYLERRGLNAGTIERYGLGYSPDGWQRLEK